MNSEFKLPLTVLFRNMDHSEAIETKARSQAEKLGRYFDRILGCRVIIESDHRHHQKGKLYRVSVTLTVPNAELVANRNPDADHAHEDVYVAIRDAFDAIKRQLIEYVDKQRGHVKHHISSPSGKIIEISPSGDHGYIEAIDGRYIWFSAKSLIDYDFQNLKIGDAVSFIETQNDEGVVASTVYVTNA